MFIISYCKFLIQSMCEIDFKIVTNRSLQYGVVIKRIRVTPFMNYIYAIFYKSLVCVDLADHFLVRLGFAMMLRFRHILQNHQ